MKTILKEISYYLHHVPHLRDNDQRLMATIWWKHLGDKIDTMSGMELLQTLALGNLPSYESISRCRRKLQEHNPELRGRSWDYRHKKQTKVKAELKELERMI